jgi:hypothetical protein
LFLFQTESNIARQTGAVMLLAIFGYESIKPEGLFFVYVARRACL